MIKATATAKVALIAGVGLLGLTGCIDGLTQIAGTGAIYHTRCSADMRADEAGYQARCTPEACIAGFTSGPVNHVVVALDPGRKVVGYAERVCFQDLSDAARPFDVTRIDGAQPVPPSPEQD